MRPRCTASSSNEVIDVARMRVDRRPKSQSGWSKHRPVTLLQREKLQEKCGDACFLVPGGTPARPGVPAYPICARLDRVGGQCVLSCPGLEAAYKRLRQGIEHYTYAPGYIRLMKAQADRAITLARQHADPRDRANTCNWSLRAKRQQP